ncbi:MAG: c-type cytochrome, partial [Waddliaceae bacterium]
MRKQAELYQISLIVIGLLVSVLFGAFFYKELFPQYRIFQDTYVELEQFRSELTQEPPPPFKGGIKQVLIENEEGGPPVIDRCISCHVALEFQTFSSTQIQRDVNGNIVRDKNGIPLQEPNPDYIWGQLDQKIEEYQQSDPAKAEHLQSLKTVKLEGHVFDMTKALAQHPLMGRETRPFEYHPIAEYGCTSCHSGNGRALTFSKAHGPVFDGQYEEEFMGPEPVFLESNPETDPPFSRIFNGKPSDKLLFQTTPILVGPLMQSKCIQCHMPSGDNYQASLRQLEIIKQRTEKDKTIKKSAFEEEKETLTTLVTLRKQLESQGKERLLRQLEKNRDDFTLPYEEREKAKAQMAFLNNPEAVEREIKRIAGTLELAERLNIAFTGQEVDANELLTQVPSGEGSLFEKARQLTAQDDTVLSLSRVPSEANLASEIDALLQDYKHGRFLFFNQACYACHRITGMSRGGVGPELTEAGSFHPWQLKESIVWPQGDLKTSTMPNFHLDHEELEALVTFLLGQTGRTQAVSETDHQAMMARWEEGYKLPWEERINPANLKDLNYAMTVFATEGCAACHRLKGYQSNVGYQKELEEAGFEELYEERQWFRKLFPEEALGSRIIESIEENREEINERIVDNVREDSILEELEANHPSVLESFYKNFKFAARDKESAEWKEIVDRVLKMYIQEYGLGRLIGPRPNWSGIYRSDEWLIEHFRQPTRHVARSIMPVMPFDDTKFYSLTYMLNTLAKRNRDEVRQIWDHRGFDPELAYEIFCSQCHGDHLHGNGPVAPWIYPIPKNLRNTYFLRNFTRENMEYSITHGVNGTPMPPWGEIGSDKPQIETPVMTESEIRQLTDWIFSSQLKGDELNVPKWEYQVDDVLQELQDEGDVLQPGREPKFFELRESQSASFFPVRRDQNVPKLSPEEVFTIEPSPKGSEPNTYHIKEKYYTEQNLAAGQRFFEANCTICHGIEADGQGFRAGTMYDAKPRMLTNLHWIDQRDDLRLLRSIKYGVPGTSMTPWGDQTSGLQRLQLVLYIRALSQEQRQRDALFSTLYRVYDQADQLIVEARAYEYKETDRLERQWSQVSKEREVLYRQAGSGKISEDRALEVYKNELSLSRQLQLHKRADELLDQLRSVVQEENELFQILGIDLIRSVVMNDLFEKYLKMISSYPVNFSL